jgi:hypothetical protein
MIKLARSYWLLNTVQQRCLGNVKYCHRVLCEFVEPHHYSHAVGYGQNCDIKTANLYANCVRTTSASLFTYIFVVPKNITDFLRYFKF